MNTMKFKSCALFILIVLAGFNVLAQNEQTLWYNAPAKAWTDALPVGNGRLGGMVHGRYDKELIQLNEESVWAGSKINNNNPQSAAHLGEIQQAIFNGEYKNAVALASKYMVGTPPRVRSYRPLGNLFIQYPFGTQATRYRRDLTLATGVSRTEFEVLGNKVVQEVYVSAPSDVLVLTISAEKPIDADIYLNREQDVNTYKSVNGLALFSGQIHDKKDTLAGPGGEHMRFATAMKLLSTDGTSSTLQSDAASGFQVKGARKLVIVLTGATDYNIEKLDFDAAIDPLAICMKKLNSASTKQEKELRAIHIADHRSFFDRVHFRLGVDQNDEIPTDERLKLVKAGGTDLGLIALYYQYGRYLLMGSSRKPGRLPANLQGIWNNLYEAPWNADFHTNINLQMNYWPAESGNLAETLEPLAHFMQKITGPGSVTAREMYNARGWTLHHLTDAFGRTGVADGVWGVSPMAGPWMTFPLYEHYAYGGDISYLRKTAYPVLKGSVEFVLDFLIKSPEGFLVTNPSHSPENAFFVPGTNKKETSQLSYATTIDTEIIHGLFNYYLKSAQVLHLDSALVGKVKLAQKQLPPFQVAANGTLQEWIHDYEETEAGHRHISHMLGLHPLNLISPKNPVLFEAAKKTIVRRLSNGGGQTGWSRAWIINFYARLLEGDKAGENVQVLLQRSTHNNLFDTHPPFQIDGNFGGAAGIAEMLLQSQNGELHILPALPSGWGEGSIKGLRAQGGYTVDISWKMGKLTHLKVTADHSGKYDVRYGGNLKKVDFKKSVARDVVF
jgi:alpha-L-fucosidase 2